ncbi:MAG TPA: MGMT family protein [Candidatus Polarisedimenticolia bacterium]|nr:MGMT family protein [Candidatus Polarisedimenticolia bacterium]
MLRRTADRKRALAGTIRLHGEIEGPRPSAWEAVYAAARRIPRGRVMTYGQIATLLGSRLSPRAVGWAMHGCPRGVPWHRVVNASGGCSTERLSHLPPGLQRALLAAEGVIFRKNGTLDLADYRWNPVPGRATGKSTGPETLRPRKPAGRPRRPSR